MAAAAAAADVGPGLRVSEDRILWPALSHWVQTRRTNRSPRSPRSPSSPRSHHALPHIASAAALNFSVGAVVASRGHRTDRLHSGF
jgi:hypothetical protein